MTRHVYEFSAHTGHMSPKAARILQEAKDRIHKGQTMEHRPVSPHVMTFARQFFPEISERTVRRSQLDIMNCMSERQKERDAGSAYRTCMVLNEQGKITLVMRMNR